ncbi:MAG TPA: YggT family protein [Anaerolineae bacterium]|nr:YggT family protein [Anaerolineae bacterium]HQK13760.1 YggT family protein [Anaerolineae bacterium]
MFIHTLIRVLDIIFGIAGLILVLRIILHLFNLSPQKPVMRALILITDPLLTLANKILGIPAYRRYDLSTVGAMVATLIVIWVGRTLIVWVLQLILYIPGWVSNPLRSLYAILVFILQLAFELYSMALLTRVLFEWIHIPYSSRVMRFLWDITEPVLAPLRRVLPPFAGLDFSPLIAFFLLSLLERLVFTMLGWIF